MNQNDVYTQWVQKRRDPPIPANFTACTMRVVRGSLEHRRRGRSMSGLTAVALAAGFLLVTIGHVMTIGLLICTLTGVAQ
jgi:hypothetical protein